MTSKEGHKQESIDSLIRSLKPAALQLILQPEAIVSELIQLSFYNLDLNKVLEVNKVLAKFHPKELLLREYLSVQTGSKYETYVPSEFEIYFLYGMKPDIIYPLNIYLGIVYNNTPSSYKYKKSIIKVCKIEEYFSTKWYHRLSFRILLNPKGLNIQEQLSSHLEKTEQKLRSLSKENESTIRRILKTMKGNIFLLNFMTTDFFGEKESEYTDSSFENSLELLPQQLTNFLSESNLLANELLEYIDEVFKNIHDYSDYDFSRERSKEEDYYGYDFGDNDDWGDYDWDDHD